MIFAPLSLQATNIGAKQNQYPNCGNPDPSKKPAFCKCDPLVQQQAAFTIAAMVAASAVQHLRAMHCSVPDKQLLVFHRDRHPQPWSCSK